MTQLDQDSQPTPHQQAAAILQRLKEELGRVVIGQNGVIEQLLVALVARGHVLIEGVPGLGKTLLVRALARCFGGDFRRIQFTPDLMPSDVTGHAMFNLQSQAFDVRKGPVFTHLLLADEINRAPAKTQSALLEVMQEGQVSIEGDSLAVPEPFMVLATQNPVEQEGTYPLPEAQLDRFMLKVLIDYPSQDDEIRLVRQMGETRQPTDAIKPFIKPQQILALQRLAQQITLDDAVLAYIVDLVRATRNWPGLSRGAGTRACLSLQAAARAYALCNQQGFVTPQDVKSLALPVLRHRIALSPDSEIEGTTPDQLLRDLITQVPAPRH